ncbi:MAG: hypothetical protein WBG50_24265 [Desulfomonilaceae bacterium]
MSESINEQLIRFVADLKSKDPKITWDDIAQRVKAKFPKAEGLSLTGNAIKKRYNNARLKESRGSKRSDNDNQGVEIAMSSKAKEQLPQGLLTFIEDYIEEYMRPVIERVSTEAAEKVFEEKFSNLQKGPLATTGGYLPAPAMPDTVEGSRRHTVPRGKLAGTVDAALLELFESERKERGFSVSRMLDAVLWNYFGIGRPKPPKLSFELSEPSHGEA